MGYLIKLFKTISENGLKRSLEEINTKIQRRLIRKQIRRFEVFKKLFSEKCGLEIGGPSWIFQTGAFLPLYEVIKELDGCNFSNTTIWEGNIQNGEKYNYFENKQGIQYISEATDLNFIPNSKYEFVISSNCLEHVANPLKAVEEWIRVIKKDGLFLLIVPKKEYCFDHNRPITKFSHLLSDYQNNTKEDDLTHLNEILELHDLSVDTQAGDFEQFRQRSLDNSNNRALHQHVFDVHLLKEIFKYFNLKIILTSVDQNHLILGRKK